MVLCVHSFSIFLFSNPPFLISAAIKINALHHMYRHRKGMSLPLGVNMRSVNPHFLIFPSISYFSWRTNRSDSLQGLFFFSFSCRVPQDTCRLCDHTEPLPWLETPSAVHQEEKSYHHHPVQRARNVCPRGKEMLCAILLGSCTAISFDHSIYTLWLPIYHTCPESLSNCF